MNNAILIEQHGALAVATLNRSEALNALNDDMRAAVAAMLPQWARDPEIYALAVRSACERAFCAGGDVRELTALAAEDPSLAAQSLAKEYALNWSLECFSKPIVSLIDGMVMGSGVGLVQYGTHRIAGKNYRFSMPETAIGLFPDVGVCSVLSRLPGNIGRYLGLTGRSIGRTTAYRLGLVTHCIDVQEYAEITAGLEAADPVDAILDGLHRESNGELDELAGREALIDDLFGQPTLAGIFEALRSSAAGTGSNATWCGKVLEELKARSPMSLHVTLRHLDAARRLDLRQVLMEDYRLAVKFLRDGDLREGVRALLIDKDGTPNWRHADIGDVQNKEIEEYFAQSVADDLNLPQRSEMQSLRG